MTKTEASILFIEELTKKCPMAARGNGEAPYKLEPSPLNMLARESLRNGISGQMSIIQRDLAWKAKYGYDKADFAQACSLSGPMDQVIEDLQGASNLFKETAVLFKEHGERMDALLDLARKIKSSEAI